MARKRRTDEGGINLDSLMDALTNVVAVLILVLILVQADVSQKVQKFLDDLAPATPEDITRSKDTIADLSRQLTIAEARLRETPPTQEVIDAETRDTALLEKSVEENKSLLADLDKLRQLITTVRAEREKENTRTTAILNEIAKIEAMLDDAPVIKTDNATVVSIPNSRPIPDKAKVYEAIAWKDRIHIIDTVAILDTFNREFERNKNAWIKKRVPTKDGERIVYDRAKINSHFSNFDWKNPYKQKITIEIPPTSYGVQILIRPDLAQGGTPIEELGKPGNEFAQGVATLKRNFSTVLMFRVHPQAFEPYLKARDLVDSVNIAAGWEITGAADHRIYVPNLLVERTQEPAETKPAGPKPPPVKPKLD